MYITRINNKVQRIITDLLFNIGKEKILIRNKNPRSLILMYHGVDKNENKNFNLRFIGVKNFEKQLIYFKKHFNIIPLSDFVEHKYRNDKFTISITFDDGYYNNYKYVYPLIEKYKIPVTFFVTALNTIQEDILWADYFDIFSKLYSNDLIINPDVYFKKRNGTYFYRESDESLNEYIKRTADYCKIRNIIKISSEKIVDFRKKEEYEDYWRLMSDEQIKEVSKSPYITIGSHALYHNRLDLIGTDELKDQLVLSKKYLENLSNIEINTLAFPCGYFDSKVIDIGHEIGYKYQFAASEDIDKQLNDIGVFGRYGVYPAVSWQNQILEFINLKQNIL